MLAKLRLSISTARNVLAVVQADTEWHRTSLSFEWFVGILYLILETISVWRVIGQTTKSEPRLHQIICRVK